MKAKIYPLQFVPILKEKIWGGQKLNTLLNKGQEQDGVGESWELSAVEGSESIISNGVYKGRSIVNLINEFPKEILGSSVYYSFGTKFPLLFKFIDAKDDLSIQVHPNNKLALERHNCLGKTEMWYIMQADSNAELVVGFNKDTDRQTYISALENKDLLPLLNEVKVQKGDVFFLETGTVHAIRAGVFLAEIQQSSDITYRVYDWNRKDKDGQFRELHTDLALDAINYNASNAKVNYVTIDNQRNILVKSPFFTTNIIPLDGEMVVFHMGEYFKVYMCVEGDFQIRYQSDTYNYTKGDTVLIPANMVDFKLIGKASLLEIYIS
ncbi:type I phosphomannose isomerase catalytic subunit [Flavobacterium ardleyense]|uniref:type I phosphomannose isomerase catalytic subunit n=1 Tax=Flavobacterium ardleyense TaxID=2038737 RepID=UPI00298CC277|nr:type I phosphomannose isomerase catalytic subunit [Flavobacterium ardleyense]